MQFNRLKNGSGHGLAESYIPADPMGLVAAVLDIIAQTPVNGPALTALKILHEADAWEVIGPDADKAYAELNT